MSEFSAKDHENEFKTAQAGIDTQYERIRNALVESKIAENPKDIKLTIGTEIEMNIIAGGEAYSSRLLKLLHNDTKAARGEDIEDKFDDSYMPKPAQFANINEKYLSHVNKLGIPKGKQTRVDLESTHRDDQLVSDTNITKDLEVIERNAASQIELVSFPSSPKGAAAWASGAMQAMMDRIEDLGIKRIETGSYVGNGLKASGIHLNSVVSVGDRNLMSASGFSGTKVEGDHVDTRLSEFALLIMRESNKFMNEGGTLIFAPAEHSYARYTDKAVTGPKHVGFETEKRFGEYGTVMGRGNERLSGNPHIYSDEERKDSGPMRVEFRAVMTEAIGHPNKKAYPNQKAFAPRAIEAYTYIIANAAEKLRDRILAREGGKNVPELTEQALIKEKFELIQDYRTADRAFRKETRKEEGNLHKLYDGRVAIILAQSKELNKIMKLDSHPYEEERKPKNPEQKERGSHVARYLNSEQKQGRAL
jgi:hypothetical protein